ncbi:MAG: transglutaminase N-terminal domain-containing protein, partial [Paracoccaceae bacterium]
MLLKVDHVTRYAYDRPVRGVVQSHRLTPSRFDGQKVLDWQVVVTDGLAGGSFRDGAGDLVQGWSVPGPVEAIEVRVTGRVETSDLAGVLRGHRELVLPDCYLNDTTATRVDAAIIALAKVAEDAADPLAAAHALSGAVADAITYVPGATQARTTAVEALA